MFICVTHVDSITKIPCTIEDMVNGPSFPKVKGLSVKWSDESNWPCNIGEYPKFYGTCSDDADTNIAGVVSVLTEEEYNQLHNEELANRALNSVPPSVSPRQARLALLKANVLPQVIEVLNNLEEPLRSAALIEWEFATEIKNTSPLIVVVKEALGWDTNQINNLFESAGKISTEDFM